MRSGNRPYLESVDHLRAFAAVLVLLFHGTQLLTPLIAAGRTAGRDDWLYSANPLATLVFEGHTAVALFMVLSGFIFTVGTLGHEVVFGRFMVNRLLRLYPLLVLLLIIGLAADWSSFRLSALAQLLLGLGNMPGAPDLGAVTSMFWAVAVELQFYLLFPLLLAVLSRFGVAALLRLLAAVALVRALVWALGERHDVYSMLYLSLAGRIDQFLLGMVAAWLYARHRTRFAGPLRVAGAAALVLAALWSFNQVHGFAANSAWRLLWLDVEGAVWALVILTYVATVRRSGPLRRLTARAGELSYSVYLLHVLVLDLVIAHRFWIHLDGLSARANALATSLFVVLPAVFTVALVTYHGVEAPFLRLRVGYLKPSGAPATGAPPAQPTAVEEPVTEGRSHTGAGRVPSARGD